MAEIKRNILLVAVLVSCAWNVEAITGEVSVCTMPEIKKENSSNRLKSDFLSIIPDGK